MLMRCFWSNDKKEKFDKKLYKKEADESFKAGSIFSAADICEFLQEAGFQQIEYETVIYPLVYSSVMALMRELKELGAHNVNAARNRDMTTRRQLQDMIAAYEAAMPDAGIVASYEIIYVRAME